MIFSELIPLSWPCSAVHHYLELEEAQTLKNEKIEKFYPTPYNGLIFFYYRSDCLRIKTALMEHKISTCGYLLSPMTKSLIIKHYGSFGLIIVYFQPGILYEILKIPLNQFTNIVVNLCKFHSTGLRKVQKAILRANENDQRKEIIEDFLIAKGLKDRDQIQARSSYLHFMIEQNIGRITVNDLSNHLHITERHLCRLFHKYFGMSPKNYIKLVRFENTLISIKNNPSIKLTELSYEMGYYDQSHFIKDFTKISGVKPLAYVRQAI